ncbi:LA_3696 family protein [Rhodothermus marinus]|uniref:LA_3696 family protein n=1 Tax=Rhodothermus marinus TaxID=29549 RepID=UPI0037C76352
MAILTVPKVLREKLGDEGVEALIALLNEAAHYERNNLLGILEERFERRVTEESKRLDNRIAEEVARLDRRITEEVKRLEVLLAETEKRLDHRLTEEVAKLDRRIAEVQVALSERYASLVRWMFIFWAGQIGVIVALFVLLR